MKYKIELEIFEGPMDLLLSLIKEKELNIYDIPIGYLTDEYLKYMDEMERLDLNLSTDFVLMAASLLEIKSRTLLPRNKIREEDAEIEEDPRQELTDKLLEYKLFKEATENLRSLGENSVKTYYRDSEDFSFFSKNNTYIDLDSNNLLKALDRVLKRASQKEKPSKEIRKEDFSTVEAMDIISKKIMASDKILFSNLLNDESTVVHVLTFFLAVLELMRLFKIKAVQDEEDIIILRYRIESN